MESLLTPFGEIKILIDGKEVPYLAQKGGNLDGLCQHVLGRYQITVSFNPDGKDHDIACVFEPSCSYERTPETGERLECQSFYNDRRFKMSIGTEGEQGIYKNFDEYDYDIDYLENGMSYHIETSTKTNSYVFGISWIDGVGWHDPIDEYDNREIETWYGADPTLAL